MSITNRATTGVHASASCICQHDHVCTQRIVQCHGVWGGGAGRHSHIAQQTGGMNEGLALQLYMTTVKGPLKGLKTVEFYVLNVKFWEVLRVFFINNSV